MATSKGQGAPTRKTKGAIGDFYVDITTGRKYKCVNAYVVSTSASGGDYDWRVVQNGETQDQTKEAPKTEEVKETKKTQKSQKAKTEAPKVEEAKADAEPAIEVEEEAPAADEKHVDYTKYSKKSK